jgi:hypothetical protein
MNRLGAAVAGFFGFLEISDKIQQFPLKSMRLASTSSSQNCFIRRALQNFTALII